MWAKIEVTNGGLRIFHRSRSYFERKQPFGFRENMKSLGLNTKLISLNLSLCQNALETDVHSKVGFLLGRMRTRVAQRSLSLKQ